ncbi:MAG: glycosyltransferase family 2 protein [Cyanobacteriota bacterium]|jgi:glycosyltransferase involved in cell wall biosynthesis
MSGRLYGWPTTLEFFDRPAQTILPEEKRISIVIPTLNQADTIEDTLLSIIHQNYMNFEIIVIDGGSTDNTQHIISKYLPWISYYISGVDSGQSNAINRGFAVATGDIYAWINSDDYYLPFAFQRISQLFACNQEIDVIVGAGDVVSKHCKFLKHITPMQMNRQNLLKWLEGEWIMQQACFWTDAIWKLSGGVDESLKLLMDFDLWLRFSKRSKSITVNEPIAVMRYYPEIKTIALKDVVNEEAAYIFAKNGEYAKVRKIVSDIAMSEKNIATIVAPPNSFMFRRILKALGAP